MLPGSIHGFLFALGPFVRSRAQLSSSGGNSDGGHSSERTLGGYSSRALWGYPVQPRGGKETRGQCVASPGHSVVPRMHATSQGGEEGGVCWTWPYTCHRCLSGPACGFGLWLCQADEQECPAWGLGYRGRVGKSRGSVTTLWGSRASVRCFRGARSGQVCRPGRVRDAQPLVVLLGMCLSRLMLTGVFNAPYRQSVALRIKGRGGPGLVLHSLVPGAWPSIGANRATPCDWSALRGSQLAPGSVTCSGHALLLCWIGVAHSSVLEL